LLAEQGKLIEGMKPMVARLPIQTQRGFLTGGLPLDEEKKKTYHASFEKVLEMVKRLYDAKIALVVGTDALPGLALHHELALYVRAGIPAADALRLDTIEAARAMKLDKKSGSIQKGKNADLVIIDGDPLARIEDLAAVVSTVKAGVVFAPGPLYESVGVRQAAK
jgi:imidazolonepropionase-like amidohydrolase